VTLGQAAAHANGIIDILRGNTYTGLAGLFVKLHTGDPGPAGTANASAVTTRNALTLAAPSSGSSSLGSLASYTMTATEGISHVSVWDNATAGTFIASGQLSAVKNVVASDVLTFDTFVVSQGPIAA
jgi:hypothetical protein